MFDNIIREMIIEEKKKSSEGFIHFSSILDIFKLIVVLRLSCSFILLNEDNKITSLERFFKKNKNDQKLTEILFDETTKKQFSDIA
jgi:hypothetical protein